MPLLSLPIMSSKAVGETNKILPGTWKPTSQKDTVSYVYTMTGRYHRSTAPTCPDLLILQAIGAYAPISATY